MYILILILSMINLKDPNSNNTLVNLRIFIGAKILKLHMTTIHLRHLLQHGMMSLVYQMNHIPIRCSRLF